MIAALAPLGRCLDFSGRSDRIEFWSFSLLGLLVAGLSYSLMNIGYWLIGTDLFDWELSRQLGKLGQVLAIIALLVFLPPMLALAVRRLHDIDESGWYVVIAFIPLGGPASLS
ncbi:DUF805 domain-containing protein [Stenotrophomonas maltophilia]|nr:DUF805 domain-containing protein [Stenotrophomonas maltophilia]